MRDELEPKHVNQCYGTCFMLGPGDYVDDRGLELISEELNTLN